MIKNYKSDYIKQDLSAGLAVAAISFPQVMAYALLAGVPPIYGLYTFIVSTIIATFTGRSSYMVVGPTDIISIAIASSLGALEIVGPENYLQFVFLLTFLVGVTQILLGSLKLGNLVHFVSQPIIVGLTVGFAFILTSSQLANILGLDLGKSAGNVINNIYRVIINISAVNYYSLGIGLFAIIIIVLSRKFTPSLPSYLVAIFLSLLVSYFFELDNYSVKTVGNFQSSLPVFNIPDFNMNAIMSLLSASLSIAILSFTQVLSIVKIMERRTGEEAEINKEFIGQGVMNIICSFFSSFAATGSFTKSFANLEAGGKTRFSQFFSGITVLIFIIFFNNIIGYIPIASLAGLVMLVALHLIDKEEIMRIFTTTKFDAVIFSATFVTTVLTPRLDYAIYFGVLVSFILVLKDTSDINYSHLSYNQNGDESFSRESLDNVIEDEYIVINLSGTLHFNTAENLKEKLNESFQKGKVFVIRMRRVEDIDVTTIQELEKFIDRVQDSGGEVIMCGIHGDIFEILDQYGIIDKVDKQNCFTVRNDIFRSTKKAIEQAEEKTDKKNKQENNS